MAPVCLVCRLFLHALLVLLLAFATVSMNVNSLLVYDRQTLLDLPHSFENVVSIELEGHKTFCPPLFSGIPAYQCRVATPPVCKTRCRCRGRCGGWLVKGTNCCCLAVCILTPRDHQVVEAVLQLSSQVISSVSNLYLHIIFQLRTNCI